MCERSLSMVLCSQFSSKVAVDSLESLHMLFGICNRHVGDKRRRPNPQIANQQVVDFIQRLRESQVDGSSFSQSTGRPPGENRLVRGSDLIRAN